MEVSRENSPRKNLSSWWRQFKSNRPTDRLDIPQQWSTPKSMSTDAVHHKPTLGSRTLSQEIIHLQSQRSPAEPRKSTSVLPSSHQTSAEYRAYRDDYLAKKHNFSGQVFGVSLEDSLSVASAEVIVQSELANFGRIPVVVAKCGAFLKDKGIDSEGIFRIAGSTKRIKELQHTFSSPPYYGAKMTSWDGYTVHDAASLLRRFLNNLKEPLIPLQLYEKFRDPLRSRPRIGRHLKRRADFHETLLNQPQAVSQNATTPAIAITAQPGLQEIPNLSPTKPHIVSSAPAEVFANASATMRANLSANELSTETVSAEEPQEGPLIAIDDVLAPPNVPALGMDSVNNSVDDLDVRDETEEERRERKQERHKKRLNRDIKAAIKEYEALLVSLTNDSKQLLVYLLDMLSLFAQHSDTNLMTARNLASIFQPSFLSHPQHDMDPEEYALSREVVEFLIEYSYRLLPHLLKLIIASAEKMVQKDLQPPEPSFKGNRPHSKSVSCTPNVPDIIKAQQPRPGMAQWASSDDTEEEHHEAVSVSSSPVLNKPLLSGNHTDSIEELSSSAPRANKRDSWFSKIAGRSANKY